MTLAGACPSKHTNYWGSDERHNSTVDRMASAATRSILGGYSRGGPRYAAPMGSAGRARVDSGRCVAAVAVVSQYEKVERGFRLILEGLGMDLEAPDLKDTPKRAAKAWWYELCAGLTQDPPHITTFPSKIDEMIVLRDIPIRSLCAHHLLPFVGTAVIAYVPGKDVILGISKLARLANYYARRPQVQEQLTNEIADAIAKLVMAPRAKRVGGVGVFIRANHFCMELRGVNHSGDMVTSALRGVFLTKPEARAEFLHLAEVK